MILIQTKTNYKNAIARIDKTIMHGANIGAKKFAEQFVMDARNELSAAILKSGGKETGNLSNSIIVKDGGGTTNYIRWDVIVDKKRAPYAEWIEAGRDAVALPYSSGGEKDFSKTKFRGHKYMASAYDKNVSSQIGLSIVAEGIVSELLKLANT